MRVAVCVLLCLALPIAPAADSHTSHSSHGSHHTKSGVHKQKLRRLRKALEEENHLKAEVYLSQLEDDLNKVASEHNGVDATLIRTQDEDLSAASASALALSKLPGDGHVPRKHKGRVSEKKEMMRLRRMVLDFQKHQAKEVEKLMVVKQGVAALVKSLNGTKMRLNQAKKESSDMEVELKNLHDQSSAAAQLQKEISEIQKHARRNYETGELELKGVDSSKIARSSMDEVAAKAALMAESELPANLADPAVLHADLRLLLDVVMLLFSATIGGILAAVINMPPIIGYIAGGIVVGPSGLGLIYTVVEVDTLAQFGSVFFLFAHGLEFSLTDLRQFQTVSVGGCLLATILTIVFLQIYSLASGLVETPLEGALLGLSASLSSLSVVLSYLQEQHLLQSTHGKVMVGYLTCQGVMMGLVFSIPPALSAGSISVGGVSIAFIRALCAGGVVILFTWGVARRFVPVLLTFLSNNQANSKELYLLGVVSLAMVMALLTEFLGLSLDLGAFFAGLMLAGTPFMEKTAVAVQPLASVFAAMLFASIGMIINPVFFINNFGTIFLLVIQIVLVKLFVVTIVVRLFNYSWRTSVISGVGLCHIGEFSLLFSSKLQAHYLISRRAYLIFLASTVTTLVIAPLGLRALKLVSQKERA